MGGGLVDWWTGGLAQVAGWKRKPKSKWKRSNHECRLRMHGFGGESLVRTTPVTALNCCRHTRFICTYTVLRTVRSTYSSCGDMTDRRL